MTPKVFISYSWSSEEHQLLVKNWAEQLIADGIDVILDLFDLKEGHDKYAFMERMVTDPSVTHVLVFSDKQYSEKADARRAGVGTESQIISKNVYEKVDQSKFIPIVCELSEGGKAYLPTFLQSRIWIDFSSPESANKNWEQLIRLLYGKPQHEKPQIGKPPRYITESNNAPSDPAISKFNAFRQALLQGKPGLSIYRKDFLEACISYADVFRIRNRPDLNTLGQKILEDCGKLKKTRDHITDWILLESSASPSDEFTASILDFLEHLIELKSRPPEITSWNDAWFDAHALFAYETFLYIVAALIKTSSFRTLHEIYTSHYLRPQSERHSDQPFEQFDTFYGYSDVIHSALSGGDQRYYSASAELINRQADRDDFPFPSIIEAELLTYLMTLITPNTRWYPGTLHYSSYARDFPLFLRATQHKHFANLATVTGISDAEALRKKVKEGLERVRNTSQGRFDRSFWAVLNMDKLDSIK
jgi:hypothetical protein